EYDKARKDLMVSIKEMYFKYRKSLIQMDIARAQVEHQRDYVAVLKEKQRFGEMEVSRVIEEIVKLTEHEYSYVQADADYYISIAGLNKAIGIPEYFRPDYENTEFIEWKQEQIGSGVPGGMKNTVSTKSKRMEKIRLAEKKRKEKKLHREIE
ncbi:MAG: TolC family protein, partial [Candidatus Omnitrophica bacterium]|nr:TolC family protein [Candidatus Omnitrophota bacterium]